MRVPSSGLVLLSFLLPATAATTFRLRGFDWLSKLNFKPVATTTTTTPTTSTTAKTTSTTITPSGGGAISTLSDNQGSETTPSVPTSKCKVVRGVQNLDMRTYTAKPWYVHQQTATPSGNPDNKYNFCAMKSYTIKDGNNLAVYSRAYEGGPLGTLREAAECGVVPDPRKYAGELRVGSCVLPSYFWGPQFIVAYNEAEGWALVSGGQPATPASNGLCCTGTGSNAAGLWILSRSAKRDEALIRKVRATAVSYGIDVALLNDVNHLYCQYK